VAELEKDAAVAEVSCAKGDARRKVRESSRPKKASASRSRDRAQREIDRIEVGLRAGPPPAAIKVHDLGGRRLLYREMREPLSPVLPRGGHWPQAIHDRVGSFDLDAEASTAGDLRLARASAGPAPEAAQVARRSEHHHYPLGMVLDCIPVIPPGPAADVQLDGGRLRHLRAERPVPPV